MEASGRREASTREQIVAAADHLFHAQGYDHTSFADVAEAVGISRGNFYYRFRSKDEILQAVVARRQAATGALLARWQAEGSNPTSRIARFIRMLLDNREQIIAHGCPVGSLCAELARLQHAARPEANALMELFGDWQASQFGELGARDARARAGHASAGAQPGHCHGGQCARRPAVPAP